jgi:hypothetical protein
MRVMAPLVIWFMTSCAPMAPHGLPLVDETSAGDQYELPDPAQRSSGGEDLIFSESTLMGRVYRTIR